MFVLHLVIVVQHTGRADSARGGAVELQFKILGDTCVRTSAGWNRDWAPPKVRKMLSALLTRPGHWFSHDQLRDWMWSEDEPLPHNLPATLHGCAAKIRAVFRQMRPQPVLSTKKGLYRLDVDRSCIDYFHCRDLLDRAIRSGRRDREQAAELVEEVLRCWGGTPLADLTGRRAEDWRRSVRVQLWIPAVNARCEHLQNAGAFDSVLTLLDDLAVEDAAALPLVVRRLQALRGAARHVDATGCYLFHYKRFRDDQDFASAEVLKKYYDDLPVVLPTAIEVPPLRALVERVVPHQLPPPTADFVDREAFLPKLDAMTGVSSGSIRPIVILLDGVAGVGKTALALHWAERVTDHFPDGQFYADLQGFAHAAKLEPTAVVDRFLEAVGVDADHITDADRRARKLATVVEGKRMLAVLDNVATAEQISTVLPLLRSSVVVVTSRWRLSGLGRWAYEVTPLKAPDAERLLAGRVGDRAREERRALAELASICAGLPLALDLVAQHIAARPGAALSEFVDQLHDERRLLAIGDHGQRSDLSLGAVFSWSYRALSEDARRRFRLLGLHPGVEISTSAASALFGEDLLATERGLALLVAAHLVDQPASLDRYRLHDLVHEYAYQCARSGEHEDERVAAESRLIDFYLHTAKEADAVVFPFRPGVEVGECSAGVLPLLFADRGEALDWCAAERENLLEVVELAVRTARFDLVWRLGHLLSDTFCVQGYYEDARAALTACLGAAQLQQERDAEAAAVNDLGGLAFKQEDYPSARKYYRLAHGMCLVLNLPLGTAVSLHNVAKVDLAIGNVDAAIELFERVLDLVRERAGEVEPGTLHRFGEVEAGTLHRLGEAARLQRRRSDAGPLLARAVELRKRIGNIAGQAESLTELARLHREQGELVTAKNHLLRALELHEEVRDQALAARTCAVLAEVERDRGKIWEATNAARSAVTLSRSAGAPTAKARSLALLAELRRRSRCFAAAEEGWEQALEVLGDNGHPLAASVAAELAELRADRDVPDARRSADASAGDVPARWFDQ
jgi:tetratricopeptide (TPR) repeat protein